MNPANLRWKYAIESLLKKQDDQRLVPRLRRCLGSLGKYPLVLREANHCLILDHFTTEVIQKMCESDKGSSTCSSVVIDLTQSDDEDVGVGRSAEQQRSSSSEGMASSCHSSKDSNYKALQALFSQDPVMQRLQSSSSSTNVKTSGKSLEKADHGRKKITSIAGQARTEKQGSKRKTRPPSENSGRFANNVMESLFSQDPVMRRLANADDDPAAPTSKKPKKTPAKRRQGTSKTTNPSAGGSSFTNLHEGRPTPLEETVFGASSSQWCSVLNNSENSLSGGGFTSCSSEAVEGPAEQQEGSSGTTRSRRKSGDYVPRKGSGGYAILLALIRNEVAEVQGACLTKDAIIKAAEPFANESMRFPKPGVDSWYSGWSSRSILIRKGLMLRNATRKPVVFCLSESGRRLAQHLWTQHETGGASSGASSTAAVDRSTGLSDSCVVDDPSWLREAARDLEAQEKSKVDLVYCYVTSSGQEVNDQDKAEVDIDEYVSYLTKCRRRVLEASGKRFRLRDKRDEKAKGPSDLVLAFIHEADCEQFSPASSSSEILAKTSILSPSLALLAKSSGTEKRDESNKPPVKGRCKKNKKSLDSFGRGTGGIALMMDLPTDIVPDAGAREDLPQSSNSPTASPIFTIDPGQYEIVLIVDSCEVTGGYHGGKKNRKTITSDLLDALQVRYELRKLSVGDFLWVARGRRCGRELVLPYIVERKRLDDLQGSIIDGRYKEQKARLVGSGLTHKIYLVEDIGKAGPGGRELWMGNANQTKGGRGIDRSTLEQAIRNTSVRDGFQVKRSKSQKESVRYLATFTKSLVARYEGLKLLAWPMASRPKTTSASSASLEEVEVHLPTFEEFREATRPDQPVKVRHVFCNMLILLKGLSPSMAWAITSKYPTPLHLHQAYERASTEEERLLLLTGTLYDGGKKARKIPASISKMVAWLFCSPTLA